MRASSYVNFRFYGISYLYLCDEDVTQSNIENPRVTLYEYIIVCENRLFLLLLLLGGSVFLRAPAGGATRSQAVSRCCEAILYIPLPPLI